MRKEEESRFVLVQQPYTLKGTRTERFLFNLVTRRKYELDEEQAAFVELCDGTRRLVDLISEYDGESRTVVVTFIQNLSDIGAVAFTNEPTPRAFAQPVADPQLRSIHFEFTSGCNMRCCHCYEEKYLHQPTDLTFREIVQLARDMQVLNVEKVGLSGGEPLVRADLFDVVAVMEEHEISITSILTNGLLLNDQVIERLRRCRSRFSVFVSLDGMRPNAMRIRGFDPHRYQKVFDRLVGNIRSAVAAGIAVMINTVVIRDNANDLVAMYQWLRKMGVQGWRIALPKFAGAYPSNTAEFAVHRSNIFRQYRAVIEEHLSSDGVTSGFRLQIEHFFRLEVVQGLAALPIEAFVCDYEGKRESVCIKPNGDVTPCPLYLDLVIGNVRQRSLGEIWYSPEMRRVKDIRICDVTGCVECKHAPLCATGCRANAIFLRGDINAPDDDACAAVEFFLHEVVPLLREKGITLPNLE